MQAYLATICRTHSGNNNSRLSNQHRRSSTYSGTMNCTNSDEHFTNINQMLWYMEVPQKYTLDQGWQWSHYSSYALGQVNNPPLVLLDFFLNWGETFFGWCSSLLPLGSWRTKWGHKSDISLFCTPSGRFKIYKWKGEEFFFWRVYVAWGGGKCGRKKWKLEGPLSC